MITHTHTVPANTSRDLFTLKVNGRPVPYGLHRGALPHQADTIALAVWRYVKDSPLGECAALWCGETPTVATYTASLCAEHGRTYADTGRW